MSDVAALTNAEKNLFMDLAYLDLPHPSDQYKGMTLRELVEGPLRIHNSADRLREITNYLDTHEDSELGSLTLKGADPAESGDNGFAAYAFEDATGKTAFTFRGTEWEDSRDMGDNLGASMLGHSSQVESAQDFFDEFGVAETDSNYLYGHSKGGNLATEVYVANLGMIGGVQVINAQPINWWALSEEQRAALSDPRYEFVVFEWDFVHLLGYVPYPVIRVKTRPECAGVGTDAHGLTAGIYDDNGDFVRSEGAPAIDAAYLGLAGGILALAALGVFGSVVGAIVIAAAALVLTVIAVEYLIAVIRDRLEDAARLVDAVVSYLLTIPDMAQALVDDIRSLLEQVGQAVRNAIASVFGGGDSGNRGLGVVVLDTARVRELAVAVSGVQRRLSSADRWIDELFWAVELKDKWTVVATDFKVGGDYKLARCKSYLESLASSFETCEARIRRHAGG